MNDGSGGETVIEGGGGGQGGYGGLGRGILQRF